MFFVSAISISFRKEEKKNKEQRRDVQQAAEAAGETKKGFLVTWPKRRPGPGFDSLAIPPCAEFLLRARSENKIVDPKGRSSSIEHWR
jgi:hypothetical protein